MIFERQLIEKCGFDHSRKRSKEAELPQLHRISMFRRITEAVLTAPVRKRGSVNCHDEFILWIELENSGALLVSECIYTLYAGEAMLVFPGQPHFRIPQEKIRAEWLLIRFAADNTAALEPLRNQVIKLDKKNIGHLQEIIALWDENTAQSQINQLSSKLLALLFSLQDNIVDKASSCPEHPMASSVNSLYVKELCELLTGSSIHGDPFETVAKKWSITKEYLHTVFRKHMGRPAREFINSRKTVLAEHLLRHSGLTITEIALQTGFQSVYAFSRFFKKETGLPPKKFRQQSRFQEER